MKIKYIKAPLNKYTFSIKPIRKWVESMCYGRVLNLFAGNTQLNLNEIRNDLREDSNAEYHKDAFDFVNSWQGDKFDCVILDPPYSYRKSMEMYQGKLNSRFKLIKDSLKSICEGSHRIITFGYHSVSMGVGRGYEQKEVLLISHGGAIHDTIATVEEIV